MKNFSRIALLLLIITGVVSYLRTGIGLFQQVRNSGLRLQMGAIDKLLELEKNTKQRYPRDFVLFMRQNFKNEINKDAAMDPWGKYFQFKSHVAGYELCSAGPDGIFGSEDDVVWKREGQKGKFLEDSKEVMATTGRLGQKSPIASTITQVQGDNDPLLAQIQVWMSAAQVESLSENERNEFIAKFLKNHWIE